MSTITDAKAHEYLDTNFGSGTPATWYIELYTAMPNDDGTGGTAVAGGSYARAAITNNATNFPAAASRQKSNQTAITYAQATANWGTILGIGFFITLTGGTVQFKKTLVASKTINNGDTFSIAIDQLVISVP